MGPGQSENQKGLDKTGERCLFFWYVKHEQILPKLRQPVSCVTLPGAQNVNSQSTYRHSSQKVWKGKKNLQFEQASIFANLMVLQLFCKAFPTFCPCFLNDLIKEEIFLCLPHWYTIFYLYKHVRNKHTPFARDQTHPLPPKKLFGEVTQHQLYHHTILERKSASTALPQQ